MLKPGDSQRRSLCLLRRHFISSDCHLTGPSMDGSVMGGSYLARTARPCVILALITLFKHKPHVKNLKMDLR